VFVGSQTGFNHHARYVLPALPLLLIGTGKLGRCFQRGPRLAAALVAVLVLCSAVNSLLVWPHSLSYFNEAAGGPAAGADHLLDSNGDWGQDLLVLKRWLDAHPEEGPVYLAYYGTVDPRLVGIDFAPPPAPAAAADPPPGLYAVSVNLLRGLPFDIPDGRGGTVKARRGGFAWLRGLRPVARVGYSLLVYRFPPDVPDRRNRPEEDLPVRQPSRHPEGRGIMRLLP
jgi:hypothetical protein